MKTVDLKSEICNPASTPHRRGMSLIEVLAAIGVLTIGLLGLAALLPVGRFTINEAAKADRTGDCGRAAMRDVVVRRMLDSAYWVDASGSAVNPTPSSFLIDPRGVLNGMNKFFGNGATKVERISLVTPLASGNPPPYTQALANQVFVWPDDLVVEMPEDMKPPQPVGRPTVMVDPTTGQPSNVGDYSWFASVVPAPNNPLQFTVSIVVCCKRDFTETVASITNGQNGTKNNFFDGGLGGGSVELSAASASAASRGPIDLATSRAVIPCGNSFTVLSGKVI